MQSDLQPSKLILYGFVEGNYLFVPVELAEERSSIWKAFYLARTWGEFWRMLPDDEESHVKEMMELIAEDFEEPEAMEYRPKDADRFDRTLLPGVADFGYPRQLQHTIVDELPRDLLDEIGGVDESPGSDGALVLQGQGGRLVDVEEVFETFGFQLVWDEERVMKASGHWWERVSIESPEA